MFSFLLVVQILVSISIISLVMLQQGKGADMGAAFGSGASSTVFGARGSASFLSRTTAALATLFFITSLALAYFASQATEVPGLMDVAAPAPAAVAEPEVEVPIPMPMDSAPSGPVESELPSIGEPAGASPEVEVPMQPEVEGKSAMSAPEETSVPAVEAPAAAEEPPQQQ